MLGIRCVLCYANIVVRIDGKHVGKHFDKNACIFSVFNILLTFHLGQLFFSQKIPVLHIYLKAYH